jgi:predicted amidophosphoribosyltransferase
MNKKKDYSLKVCVGCGRDTTSSTVICIRCRKRSKANDSDPYVHYPTLSYRRITEHGGDDYSEEYTPD